MESFRCDGTLPLRLAARQYLAPRYQQPGRMTRREPVDGPWRSVTVSLGHSRNDQILTPGWDDYWKARAAPQNPPMWPFGSRKRDEAIAEQR